jgi:hypothetical protein
MDKTIEHDGLDYSVTRSVGAPFTLNIREMSQHVARLGLDNRSFC